MQQEIWKDIKGYEGLYQVSSFGNVKSKRKVLSKRVTNSGYISIGLWKKGKRKEKLAHRLVAEAFINNPNKLPIINHIDENKINNNVKNLEWCSHSYNTNVYTKNHIEEIKEKASRCKLNTKYGNTYKNILQSTLDGGKIKIWANSITIKKILGFDNSAILKCCRGKRKTAYGYKWQFAN